MTFAEGCVAGMASQREARKRKNPIGRDSPWRCSYDEPIQSKPFSLSKEGRVAFELNSLAPFAGEKEVSTLRRGPAERLV